MYNLTVEQAHTFFVGKHQWLVHNTCNPADIRAKALELAPQYLHKDKTVVAFLFDGEGNVIRDAKGNPIFGQSSGLRGGKYASLDNFVDVIRNNLTADKVRYNPIDCAEPHCLDKFVRSVGAKDADTHFFDSLTIVAVQRLGRSSRIVIDPCSNCRVLLRNLGIDFVGQ